MKREVMNVRVIKFRAASLTPASTTGAERELHADDPGLVDLKGTDKRKFRGFNSKRGRGTCFPRSPSSLLLFPFIWRE